MTSTVYEAARVEDEISFHAFVAATMDYRAGKISDAKFLAARSARDEARKVFDAAWEVEAGCTDETKATARRHVAAINAARCND